MWNKTPNKYLVKEPRAPPTAIKSNVKLDLLFLFMILNKTYNNIYKYNMHMSDQLINTTVTWLKYLGNYSNKSLSNNNNVKIDKINKISTNFYKKIYKEIGTKYNWISRLKLNEKELKEIIHDKNVEIYLMTVKSSFVGFLEIDYRSLKEIKIVHLGLIESYIGKGYGKILLNFAIDKAEKIGITPLILQTNSLDHPNALMFYQKNGFQVISRRNAKVIRSYIKNEKLYK